MCVVQDVEIGHSLHWYVQRPERANYHRQSVFATAVGEHDIWPALLGERPFMQGVSDSSENAGITVTFSYHNLFVEHSVEDV